MVPPTEKRMPLRRLRRRVRKIALVAALVPAAWLAAVPVFDVKLTLPFDYAISAWPVPVYDDLRASEPTLVVLQHGLFRSAASMWRIERALEAHGYEVSNPDYPSTAQRIEQHGQRLRAAVERALEGRTPRPRLAFVGHSMGGLVIRSCLAGPDAPEADACVFIATPQRGAELAARRCHLAVFDLFLGDQAALQLVPGDPFYAQLPALCCERIGIVYGGRGDGEGWNSDIPGDDDRTVGVDEAQLPEQTDAVMVPFDHTHIAVADETLRQVLTFLKHGRFAPRPPVR